MKELRAILHLPRGAGRGVADFCEGGWVTPFKLLVSVVAPVTLVCLQLPHEQMTVHLQLSGSLTQLVRDVLQARASRVFSSGSRGARS